MTATQAADLLQTLHRIDSGQTVEIIFLFGIVLALFFILLTGRR